MPKQVCTSQHYIYSYIIVDKILLYTHVPTNPINLFQLATYRYLPNMKTSRGVGPSSLSQCLEELLGEWEDLKVHFEESGNTNTPLRRSNPTPRPTPQSSQHPFERGGSQVLEKHINFSAKKWTRMSF